MGGCGVSSKWFTDGVQIYKMPPDDLGMYQFAKEYWNEEPIYLIEYTAYEAQQKRIEQLEAELKNEDAVRLWNENEKLKEANLILRDGLDKLHIKVGSCAYSDSHQWGNVMELVYRTSKQALEQADKIMEGDEG
jgi:hypothetical protein